MHYFLILILPALLVASLGPIHSAQAQEQVVCFTKFVCDQDTGDIMPEYNDPFSPCFAEWQIQCANYSANMMADQLTQCQSRVGSVRHRNQNVRERNQLLQQRIKRLRSRIRQLS